MSENPVWSLGCGNCWLVRLVCADGNNSTFRIVSGGQKAHFAGHSRLGVAPTIPGRGASRKTGGRRVSSIIRRILLTSIHHHPDCQPWTRRHVQLDGERLRVLVVDDNTNAAHALAISVALRISSAGWPTAVLRPSNSNRLASACDRDGHFDAPMQRLPGGTDAASECSHVRDRHHCFYCPGRNGSTAAHCRSRVRRVLPERQGTEPSCFIDYAPRPLTSTSNG